MSFNSIGYIIFFAAVLVVSWRLLRWSALRMWMLLLASFYFYYSHNYSFILLIILSTQIDFVCGLLLGRFKGVRSRKSVLLFSMISNLGILAFFKYFNFFGDSFCQMAGGLGWQLDWFDLNVFLPVGISFYTFQSMSYTIDVYRGEIPTEKSWVRFSLFVAYFPQLVAGPIVRAKTFLPQLHRDPVLTEADLEDGLFRIFRGFFKKVALADFLGIYVDQLYASPMEASWVLAWLGFYGFALQIYFDFSGYTDIAIGCARLMGYRLPDNFRRPYMAAGFTDFWRRWHITLSTWLRDYLYRSLGGNRKGKVKTLRNVMITMLLGGLWHGAAWNFVIWGFWHGILLCLERIRRFRIPAGEVVQSKGFVRFLSVAVTFHLVCLSWIFFRSENMQIAGQVFGAMFQRPVLTDINNGVLIGFGIVAAGLGIQALSETRFDYVRGFLKLPIPVKCAVYSVIAVAVTVMGCASEQTFIYFQF